MTASQATSNLLHEFQQECKTILDKTQEMTESLRTIVCKQTARNVIPHQIKYTRKVIEDSFENFKNMKTYFHRLSIPYAFEVVQENYVLLTFALNSLSHVFLATLRSQQGGSGDMIKINKKIEVKEQENKKNSINSLKFLKSENKKDPLFFDNEIEEDIIDFQESATSNIINELLEYFDRMNQNSKKIQQTEIDFTQISSIKNSIQFGEQMINNFKKQGHHKIYIAAIKVAQMFLENYKKKMKKTTAEKQVQTDTQSQNIQQLQKMILENDKKYEIISQQKRYLKQKLTQTSDEAFRFMKKVEGLEQVLATHIKQISHMKTKTLHQNKKHQEIVSLLRHRIVYLESENKKAEKELSDEEEDFIDEKSLQSSSLNNTLGKSIGSKKASIHYYEKQLQSQKKYNLQMRKSLQLLITVLNNNKLVGYNPKNKDSNDFTAGRVRETVEIVSAQLEKQLQRNKQRFSCQPIKKMTSTRSRNKQNVIQMESQHPYAHKNDQQVQTILSNDFDITAFFGQRDDLIKKIGNQKNLSKRNTSHFYPQKNSRKNLDGLREQLIRRVLRNRKNKNNKQFITQDNSKIVKATQNLFNDSMELPNKQFNTSFQNDNTRTHKTFNDLNVHFQELIIKETGDQIKKKKNQFAISKSKLSAFNGSEKNMKKYEPIIAVEGFQSKAEAHKMIQYLENKNDRSDKFFKKFMKSFIQEITKKKGINFMDSILKQKNKAHRTNHERSQSNAFIFRK